MARDVLTEIDDKEPAVKKIKTEPFNVRKIKTEPFSVQKIKTEPCYPLLQIDNFLSEKGYMSDDYDEPILPAWKVLWHLLKRELWKL